MHWRSTIVLMAAVRSGAACAAETPRPAAIAPRPDPTWIELDGTRMLVTTTGAARGRAERDLPILVVLSWARSTPAELLAEVRYADIDVPARVIAIEAFERDGEGFSWWRRTRPAPPDPDRDAELASLLTDRAARLAALLGAVRHAYGSAAPLVVSGVSQGGDLSIALGVHHPASITAALPIAARFPEPMWPSAGPGPARPPIDAFQGIADPVAPLAALQRAFAALRDHGYPVALHAYADTAHEVSPALRADILACAAIRLRGLREPCRGSSWRQNPAGLQTRGEDDDEKDCLFDCGAGGALRGVCDGSRVIGQPLFAGQQGAVDGRDRCTGPARTALGRSGHW